jgi:hypothetical protein
MFDLKAGCSLPDFAIDAEEEWYADLADEEMVRGFYGLGRIFAVRFARPDRWAGQVTLPGQALEYP